MFHSHNSPIAIAFTGGVDSSTLAHYVCKTLDHYDNFVTPIPKAEGQATDVHLLACNYGQANWPITSKLLGVHSKLLDVRYGEKVNINTHVLEVKLPVWEDRIGGLFEHGFVPPKQDEDLDTSPTRTYDYALVNGRNWFLFGYMLSWCANRKVPVLLTGYECEENEWRTLDSYKSRTEDFGPMFQDRINLLQEVGFNYRVRVDSPFLSMRMTRYNICQMAKELDIDLGSQSYSCQFAPPCGKCDGCVIRRKSFGLLNIKEGTLGVQQ